MMSYQRLYDVIVQERMADMRREAAQQRLAQTVKQPGLRVYLARRLGRGMIALGKRMVAQGYMHGAARRA